jgi:hypothetical protein
VLAGGEEMPLSLKSALRQTASEVGSSWEEKGIHSTHIGLGGRGTFLIARGHLNNNKVSCIAMCATASWTGEEVRTFPRAEGAFGRGFLGFYWAPGNGTLPGGDYKGSTYTHGA